MHSRVRVLADTWYAPLLGPTSVPLQPRIEGQFPDRLVRLAQRVSPVRGVLIFLLAGAFDAVILGAHSPGAWTAVVLEALFRRRRRIILLEFMQARPGGWRRLVYPIWFALVRRPALRKVLLLAHTLTEFERHRYARGYGLPVDR